MEKTILINHINLKEIGDRVELSATISFSDDLAKDFTLWFRFTNMLPGNINTGGDAFLAIILPIALQHRYNIVVRSQVSEKLMHGLCHIMNLWERWFPKTHPIEIKADDVVIRKNKRENTGMFFSGGVDSFYTLLKNRNEGRSKFITSLIFAQGFDISIQNNALYDKIYHRIKRIADHFEVNLIEASTNIRMLSERFVHWGKHEHGAALAGTGLALSGGFKNIFIAASDSYAGSWASRWGSHPLMDPLWSTESLEFIHDGSEATRVQKVCWQISESDIAKKNLRVCFENPDNDYNCCKCDKCVRAMIDLRIAGVLEECCTFQEKLTFDQIQGLSNTGANFAKMSRSLQELKHSTVDPDLRCALEKFLKNKSKKRLKSVIKKIKGVVPFGL